MNFLSLLRKQEVDYRSLRWHNSETTPGVRYATRQISLSQRIELTHRVRKLSLKHEFLKAGPLSDQLESSLSDLLATKVYLQWGLLELQGLFIDGRRATTDSLIDDGPEGLTNEIAGKIREEISLSEEERKNS